MTAIDQPSLPTVREVIPAGWLRPIKEEKTPFQAAKEHFANWNRILAEFEKLWETHVYHNGNFSEIDARQHRGSLYSLLAQGEVLGVELITLNVPKETESYLSFLDGQLERLKAILFEWYGPVDASVGIPADFAIGMRELAEGKIFDLGEVLNEPPSLFPEDVPVQSN